MQGTLIGLTNTGLDPEASMQAALFAIETADQVLRLMDATPLQRQVLGVLTLERFTEWLLAFAPATVVGSLSNEDHPVCLYVQRRCGVSLNFSQHVLHDQRGICVLGHNSNTPMTHELPLDIAGAWLPALLEWKAFDSDTEEPHLTFKAREVLAFLEPFQR